MKSCVGAWRYYHWIVILCKLYLNFDVLATTLGFLIGSFPMEPWTKMHNRERKNIMKFSLQCSHMISNVGICMWENSLEDNVLKCEGVVVVFNSYDHG